MNYASVFDDTNYGHSHSAVLIAETIAGGKSSITPAMRIALDVIAADPESVLFSQDIDYLANNRYVNMFERDGHGLPYLEDYVVHATLRQTSKKVANLRCMSSDTDNMFMMDTESYVNNELSVVPSKIYLRSPDSGDIYKYGRMVPITFYDADGVQNTRFVEVFDNVKLQMNINVMVENDRWHMLWRAAMTSGIGAARHHGYGKFVVADWS